VIALEKLQKPRLQGASDWANIISDYAQAFECMASFKISVDFHLWIRLPSIAPSVRAFKAIPSFLHPLLTISPASIQANSHVDFSCLLCVTQVFAYYAVCPFGVSPAT